MSAALELRELSCGHGGLPVVRRLSLTVEEGEVVALLGANGAGKTTTLLAVAGVLPILDGDVLLLGRSVRGRPTHRIARMGVALVPEDHGLFTRLSVGENLRLSHRPGIDRHPGEVLADFPALSGLLDRRAGLLSGGEQRMLALARAIASKPRVLMVDELSLGLAPIVTGEILTTMRRLAETTGMAVLLVEQHVHVALGVADRAYVLSRGELALTGSAADVARGYEVVEASYFGDVR